MDATPTYNRSGESGIGDQIGPETADVSTRGGRHHAGAIAFGPRFGAGFALGLLITCGCSDPEEKLPPRRASAEAGSRDTVDTPPARSLPAEVPPRPTFPPSGASDGEKLQARLRDECFDVAESLLKESPGDPAGWTLLGTVHRFYGDDHGAATLWNHALTIDAGWPDALRQLGDAAFERGDHATAETRYREALDADPGSLVILDSLVETLLSKSDTSAAEDLLEGYLADHPRVPEGWCLLGKTRLVVGDAVAARAAFEQAIEVEPTSRDAVHGLAEAIQNIGRAEPLPVSLELVHRLRDRRDAAHPVRPLEALDGVGPAPWTATVNYWAALAHARLGDVTRAAIGWRRAIELDPDDHQSRESLATLYEQTGRTREAMSVRQAWCDRSPESPAAWFGIGRLALTLGLQEEAASALEHVVALAPERAEGHALLARAQATLDPAAALEAARRAVDLDPTAPHLTLLGDTLLRGGEDDEAAAAYERALALDAEDDRARAGLDRARRSR